MLTYLEKPVDDIFDILRMGQFYQFGSGINTYCSLREYVELSIQKFGSTEIIKAKLKC